ncbi:MAG: radical SAM protein [Bacillota bacterium]|nr:radical SAM protein [Bacillota bacterium]
MGGLRLKVFPELRHLSSDGVSNILLDVNSCRIFEAEDALLEVLLVMDDPSPDWARLRLQYGDQHIDECLSFARNLVDSGTLVRDEQLHHMKEHVNRDIAVTSLTLNIAHTCQLRCRYCFANTGNYGLDDGISLMSFDTAKQAIDILNQLRGNQKAQIVFFGGEPLLNWEVLERSVGYAEATFAGPDRKPNVSFCITTNGLALIQSQARFFKEHPFSVILSIDGDRDTHNKLRPCKTDDVDSWAGTIAAFQILTGEGITPRARVTVTSSNTNLVQALHDLGELGFGSINMQPVHTPADKSLTLSHDDLLVYESHVSTMMRSRPLVFADGRRLVARIGDGDMGIWFCAVATGSLTVSPSGELYPCHRLMGIPRFRIGNVHDDGILKALDARETLDVDKSLVCTRCWAKYLCRGGCYAENYNATGKLQMPDPFRCHLTKHIIGRALECYLFSRRDAANTGGDK